MSSPEAAYQRLAVFFQRNRARVAEIEILPTHLAPPSEDSSGIYESGQDLAVTKRALAGAFVAARTLFFSHRSGTESTAGPASLSPPSTVDPAAEIVRDATAVILLFAPEHTTAANWRKHWLLSSLACTSDPGRYPVATASALADQLAAELVLLTSLTTSPLPKHPKSPTLWAHRAWVVWGCNAAGKRWLRVLCEAAGGPAAFWCSEVRVVLAAAARHFANYYAFDYARRLRRALLDEWQDEWPVTAMPTKGDGGTSDEVLVREWCCRHPSDISGWAFLEFLVRGHESLRAEVESDAIAFARHVGAKGEAMQWFLHAMGRSTE